MSERLTQALTQAEALRFLRDLHSGAMAPPSRAELEELGGHVARYELDRAAAGRPDGSYSAMLAELRSREDLLAELGGAEMHLARRRSEELALRMLGETVTFTRSQWEQLLEELRPAGELARRVRELLSALQVLPIPAPSQERTYYRAGYRSTDGAWYSVGPWHDSRAAAEAWADERRRALVS
jgi:hypothetical protein